MFGRRPKEVAPEEENAPEVDQSVVAEHEAPAREVDVIAPLGAAALPEQKGFQAHESGLLVPDQSAEVSMVNNNESLVTDSRRVTLETVEANFKAEQERLQSPLDGHEVDEAVHVIKEQMQQRVDQYKGEDRTYRSDIKRDIAAMRRVENVIKGERDMYVAHVTSRDEKLNPSEMLGRVVAQYAELVPENFGPDSNIGSMGGTVDIPEDGVIHCSGYNGSILYEFARAQQICKKLETMPEEVRTKLLEASSDADASWLYEEPVVIDRQPTKEPVAA